MTHDELLDTIGHWNWIKPKPLLNALRAVVELHKPLTSNDFTYCPECQYGSAAGTYPCPTIQAIEKELG